MGKLTFSQKSRRMLCQWTWLLCYFFLSPHPHLCDFTDKLDIQKRWAWSWLANMKGMFMYLISNGALIMVLKWWQLSIAVSKDQLFKRLLFVDEFKILNVFSVYVYLFLFSINQCFELRIRSGSIHLVTVPLPSLWVLNSLDFYDL